MKERINNVMQVTEKKCFWAHMPSDDFGKKLSDYRIFTINLMCKSFCDN